MGEGVFFFHMHHHAGELRIAGLSSGRRDTIPFFRSSVHHHLAASNGNGAGPAILLLCALSYVCIVKKGVRTCFSFLSPSPAPKTPIKPGKKSPLILLLSLFSQSNQFSLEMVPSGRLISIHNGNGFLTFFPKKKGKLRKGFFVLF